MQPSLDCSCEGIPCFRLITTWRLIRYGWELSIVAFSCSMTEHGSHCLLSRNSHPYQIFHSSLFVPLSPTMQPPSWWRWMEQVSMPTTRRLARQIYFWIRMADQRMYCMAMASMPFARTILATFGWAPIQEVWIWLFLWSIPWSLCAMSISTASRLSIMVWTMLCRAWMHRAAIARYGMLPTRGWASMTSKPICGIIPYIIRWRLPFVRLPMARSWWEPMVMASFRFMPMEAVVGLTLCRMAS